MDCIFSATSHRVSEDIRIKEHDKSRYESTPTEDGAGQQSHVDEPFDFSAVLQSSDMAQSLGNIDEECFQTVLDPASFSPMQMTAWPWLHEDLFFQNDTPNDWYQVMMDELKDGDNAGSLMLVNSISGPGVSMSPPSAGDNFSRELLQHTVSGDISLQPTENGIIQPIAEPNSTLSSHTNRHLSHSKLYGHWSLLVDAS
jgi:hypothetical protein